ncbi:MAG TPA: hypothetical protein VGE29_07800 [Prosthecobacter sp.]
MKMICAFLGLLCSPMLPASPLISNLPASIVSAQLQVKLQDEVAEMEGRFRFQAAAFSNTSKSTVPVDITLPMWLPSDLAACDQATAALLRRCKRGTRNTLKDENFEALWKAATGLELSVGDQPLNITAVWIFDSESEEDLHRLPAAYFRKGYLSLIVKAHCPSEWLSKNPEVHVRYRQSLSKQGNRHEFHYLPDFRPMPEAQTGGDQKRYALHLTNASGGVAVWGGMKILSGRSAVLPLTHEKPVNILLTPGH